MLAYQLETLDGVEDSIAPLYEKKGDKYQLIVDGLPKGDDLNGLKNKVDELLAEKKAEKEKREAAEREATQAKEDEAKKKSDYKSLSEAYEKKITDLNSTIDGMKKEINKDKISTEAMKIAAEISEGANQKILSRFIEDRLRMEDGELKVTDSNGNLTISTVDQLKEEFKSSGDYASLVIGSRASGGGAEGERGGSGAAKKFSEYNEQERLTLYRTNKEEYQKLKNEETN